MRYPSYVIDPNKFQQALASSGYSSIQSLAQELGLHRNTIHHFLSGASVFPESVAKILGALGIEPSDLIKKDKKEYGLETIAGLVDALLERKRDMCVVLFGSRGRGTSKRFSDYDLGVYSQHGIDHEIYLKLISCKEEKAEDLPVTVDLVNLNRADRKFLLGIGGDMRFLGGRLSDWLALKGGCHG